MGRVEKLSVIDRGGPNWYYKLPGMRSYRSLGLPIRRNKQGKPTNYNQAMQEAIQRQHVEELTKNRKDYRELLQDAWTENDPRIRAMLTDWNGRGRPPIQQRTIDEARRRILLYILGDDETAPDPIARALPEAGIAPWLEWKERCKDRGASARTVNQTLREVATALNYRVKLGELNFHPVGAVPRMQESSDHTGIFTIDEIRAMVGHPDWFGYDVLDPHGKIRYRRDEENRKRQPIAYAMAVTLLGTLARPIELQHVRWRDLDENDKLLRLTYTKKVRGGNGDGRRVPLAETVLKAIRGARDVTEYGGPDDYIFPSADGGMHHRTWFRKRWEHMMLASGFAATDADGNTRVPYSLKHSAMTALLELGANPRDLAALAGHSLRSAGEAALTVVQQHYAVVRAEHLKTELIPLVDKMLTPPDGDNVLSFRRTGTDNSV